jgi:hypothetical protein
MPIQFDGTTVYGPNWGNIKWAAPLVYNPMRDILTMLAGSDFAPAYEDMTLQGWLWGLTIKIHPDWHDGQVREIEFDPAAKARVTHQVVNFDGSPVPDLTIDLFEPGDDIPIGSALTDSNGVVVFNNLDLEIGYVIRVPVPKQPEPLWMDSYTDPYGGQHIDSDGDGDIDLVIIHYGWFPDPNFPDPMVRRQWPIILPPPEGFATFPMIFLFDNDTVDISLHGQPGFINGPTYDLRFASGTLQSATGVSIIDVDEEGLGLLGGLEEAILKGGDPPLTSIDAYGTTPATSITPTQWVDGVKNASLYVIRVPGDWFDLNHNGAQDPGEEIAWLIEPVDLTVDSITFMFAIITADGFVFIPPDPNAPSFNIADYWPIIVGDKKHFVIYTDYMGAPVEKEVETEEIGSEETLPNGVLAYPVMYYDPLPEPGAYFKLEDGNLLLIGFKEDTKYELFSPPVFLGGPDSKIGEKIATDTIVEIWEGGVKVDEEEERIVIEFIGFESVTVPAGTFEDCLIIGYTFVDPVTGDWAGGGMLWLAKGIGYVKYEEFEQEGHGVGELVRYEPTGKAPIGADISEMFGHHICVGYDGTNYYIYFEASVFLGSSITSITVSGPGITPTVLDFDGVDTFKKILSFATAPGVGDVYQFTPDVGAPETNKVYSVISTLPTITSIDQSTENPIFYWDPPAGVTDIVWLEVVVYWWNGVEWEEKWRSEDLDLDATSVTCDYDHITGSGNYRVTVYYWDGYYAFTQDIEPYTY